MSKADQIAFMKVKAVQFGFEVIEKPDGTVEMKRSAKK
jgi:phosphosulfolactate synthase (CoM biosynthesis protein A)